MRRIPGLLLVTILAGALGQGTTAPSFSFVPGPQIPEIAQPFSRAIIADVNSDGYPDLVYPGAAPGADTLGLQVLPGTADGTFGAPISSVSGLVFEDGSLTAADVNGDGIPDLVVYTYLGNVTAPSGAEIEVLLGNGDGTFELSSSFAAPISIGVGVAVADFNGDGNLDLAGGSSSNSIPVWLGNGDGSFQASSNYSTGSVLPCYVLSGDFNRDGRADLIGVGCDQSLAFLAGAGDGTFSVPATTSAPSPFGGVFAAATADFNGNGIPDLAVGALCAAAVPCITIYLSTGKGSFAPPATYVELGGGGTLAAWRLRTSTRMECRTSFRSVSGWTCFWEIRTALFEASCSMLP